MSCEVFWINLSFHGVRQEPRALPPTITRPARSFVSIQMSNPDIVIQHNWQGKQVIKSVESLTEHARLAEGDSSWKRNDQLQIGGTGVIGGTLFCDEPRWNHSEQHGTIGLVDRLIVRGTGFLWSIYIRTRRVNPIRNYLATVLDRSRVSRLASCLRSGRRGASAATMEHGGGGMWRRGVVPSDPHRRLPIDYICSPLVRMRYNPIGWLGWKISMQIGL